MSELNKRRESCWGLILESHDSRSDDIFGLGCVYPRHLFQIIFRVFLNFKDTFVDSGSSGYVGILYTWVSDPISNFFLRCVSRSADISIFFFWFWVTSHVTRAMLPQESRLQRKPLRTGRTWLMHKPGKSPREYLTSSLLDQRQRTAMIIYS